MKFKNKPHYDSCGYVQIMIDGKLYKRSRLVWEHHNGKIPKGMEVDHINHVRDDDRIENLQLLTHKQNCQRRPVRGYTIRNGKYRANRMVNDKYTMLGTYGTPCGARMAYNTALL